MSTGKENLKGKCKTRIPVVNPERKKQKTEARCPLGTLSHHDNQDNCEAGPSTPNTLDTRKCKSRIPVVHPERKKQKTEARCPLGTLSHHDNQDNCVAGPSTSNTFDTRYVTLRDSKKENLDWAFCVFKDDEKEKNSKKTDGGNVNDKAIVNNESSAPTMDVVLKPPPKVPGSKNEGNRIFKKPFPNLNNDGSQENQKAKSCNFPLTSKNQEPVTYKYSQQRECFDPLNKYAIDNLHYLQASEQKLTQEESYIRNASRTCIINWIINVNGSSGNPAVVQLASWYLDCYLRNNVVAVHRLQVIAAACFWIATKFYGDQVSARRLVKFSANAFVESELVTAEKSILRKLKYRAHPVPHDFVPYLGWCCDQSGTGLIEAAAVFVCQCGIMINKTHVEEYPSVIAAAAVKNALLLLKKDSWLAGLESCDIYKAAVAKATHLPKTCAVLHDAVKMVCAEGHEYKAPVYKFIGPPHNISAKIVRAVLPKNVVLLDMIHKRNLKKSL